MALVRIHILLFISASMFPGVPGKPQHVVFILADDMGFNDVGFHGSDEIPTPNIDALCYGGIILNNHYVQPICTPSRAALMTGKYPMHLGLQHFVIIEGEPRGLPLKEKLIPEHLKDFNYVNGIIGKWHLGFYKKIYTPLYRGFDSHFGFYNGLHDYYDHTFISADDLYARGLDMRRDLLPEWNTQNNYSTRLFTQEAVNTILQHNTDRPLFLYVPHIAPHAGNKDDPLQAPASKVLMFPHIRNKDRRIYAAMVSELDDSVGRVVEALAKRGMLEDSIVVFLSDNGAPVHGMYQNSGSNEPFRGQKDTPFEGAVRTPACVWSRKIKNQGRVSSQLMHITDWLPTLYSSAGGNISHLGPIDGIDMWNALSENLESPRQEVLINIDEKTPYAALRVGHLKYVVGTTYNGTFDKWYSSMQELGNPPYNIAEVYKSKVAQAFASIGYLLPHNILSLRSKAAINCGTRKASDYPCNAVKAPCLFDLESDPCEHNNLYGCHPASAMMDDRLKQYSETLVPAANTNLDEMANPKYWNNTWTYWLDTEKEMSISKI